MANVACDPQSLVTPAVCNLSCIPQGMQDAVIISLLCQIANNGGTGGGGAPDNITYPGPPIVNPPALQYIVVDVNGVQWQFFNNTWN